MKKSLAVLLLLLISPIALADQYTAIYPGGDASAGKALVQKIVFLAMLVALVAMARAFTHARIVSLKLHVD